MANILVAPSSDTQWVELAHTQQGKLYKKHILSVGPLKYRGKVINLSAEYLQSMVKNFNEGIVPIVQVPLVDDANQHSERPDLNTGVVTKLEFSGGKLYAYIDARKYVDDFGKTLLGASAAFQEGYLDTRNGDAKIANGPVLTHVAVTNRPYLVDLEDFQPVQLSNALGEEESKEISILTPVDVEPSEASSDNVTDTELLVEETTLSVEKEIEMPNTREELIAQLKTEHGIDVVALQEQASLVTVLSNALSQAGAVKLSNSNAVATNDEIVSAVAELATNNVTLSSEVRELKRESAQALVAGLVSEGRITPDDATVAGWVELRLSNPAQFDLLVPKTPVIALSQEAGTSEEPPVADGTLDVDAEVARLLKS